MARGGDNDDEDWDRDRDLNRDDGKAPAAGGTGSGGGRGRSAKGGGGTGARGAAKAKSAGPESASGGGSDGRSALSPRANPDLFGHEAAERCLAEACCGGRLHHAWLISGIPGIGKATLAYRFARFVLAGGVDGRDNTGTGATGGALALAPDHPVFKRVRSGGHADLLTIERQFDDKRNRLKVDIAVDDVRLIPQFLHQTTAGGGWRVVVVDGVERMNSAGLNAILKILEEPPDRTLLLLVTTAAGALLPTLRSRCRKLRLEPLADPVVDTLLARYRPGLGDEERHLLTTLAEGSIGQALDRADAGGVALYKRLETLLAPLPQLDWRATHALIDEMVAGADEGRFEATRDLIRNWLARRIRQGVAENEPAARMERRLAGWDRITQHFARVDAIALDRRQTLLTVFATLAGVEAGG